jgi:hypothetical protein
MSRDGQCNTVAGLFTEIVNDAKCMRKTQSNTNITSRRASVKPVIRRGMKINHKQQGNSSYAVNGNTSEW